MHLRGQCPSFPGDALGGWHLRWNFHMHRFSHVAKRNWSFEVVFVIAPQKRRQGIDIDGSIPAGFFLSIFLLAIQASLLYLGWSVFHNIHILSTWKYHHISDFYVWGSTTMIWINDIDFFGWVPLPAIWNFGSLCWRWADVSCWVQPEAIDRTTATTSTWTKMRSDMPQVIRWFSTSTTSMIVVPMCPIFRYRHK